MDGSDIAEVWSPQKKKDIPLKVENTRITPAKGRITIHFALVDQATGSRMSSGGNQEINQMEVAQKEVGNKSEYKIMFKDVRTLVMSVGLVVVAVVVIVVYQIGI